MLSESDRKHAAQLLLTAEAEQKPVRQLSKTWPDITIDDAYAIQGEVIRHKTAAGARIFDTMADNAAAADVVLGGRPVGPFGTVLEAGHLVLSGSFTRSVWANKGDTIHGDFGAL